MQGASGNTYQSRRWLSGITLSQFLDICRKRNPEKFILYVLQTLQYKDMMYMDDHLANGALPRLVHHILSACNCVLTIVLSYLRVRHYRLLKVSNYWLHMKLTELHSLYVLVSVLTHSVIHLVTLRPLWLVKYREEQHQHLIWMLRVHSSLQYINCSWK